MLSQSKARKIAIALIIIFVIAMTPPVILLIDSPTTVFGIAQIYLWSVIWAVFISILLIWAAWRDVFALTQDQVPPELRDEDVMTEQSDAVEESTTGGSE